MTLNDYITQVQVLTHDPNNRYSSAELKRQAVNLGIQQRDQDTGANRLLFPFTLTAGTDTYTLSDLVAAGQTAAARAFDIVGINLLYNSVRFVMGNLSFTRLNAGVRFYVNSTNLPIAWTKYNPSTVIFGPKPGTAYSTEWDCSVSSADLVNPTDADVLVGTYAGPVPFYAAFWCKQNERQPQEADNFLKEYYRKITICQGARAGMLPSAYQTYGR